MEDRLQKFARLVDAGSFTGAAEEMHLSQPALSAAISKLERELHATLLLRASRPLKLTPAGEAAYAHAKGSAIRVGNLKRHIAVGTNEKITLKLGLIDSLANVLFERSDGFKALEQHASVSLIVNNSRFLTEAVVRDDIDIAFVVRQPNYPASITAVDIGAEPLVFVCHHALLASTNQAIARRQLPHFISYDQSSTTSRLVQRRFVDQGVSLQSTFYSTSPEVICKLVLAQKGIAALPHSMVKDLIDQQLLAAVTIGNSAVVERRIQAVQRRDKDLPSSVQHVTTGLRNILYTLKNEAPRQ